MFSMAASLCSLVHTRALSRAFRRYLDWFLRGSAAQLCRAFLWTSSTLLSWSAVKSHL